MGKVLVLYSGGLDSTVLLWELRHRGLVAECLTVDYGQGARGELIAAGRLCRHLEVEQHLVSVPNLQYQLQPQGAGFPGRRLLLLSLAVAVACAREIDTVAYAERIDTSLADWNHAAAHLVDLGHKGRIALYAPYQERTKEDLLRRGRRLRVPFRHTWSCVRSDRIHCGRCRPCVQRLRAFRAAQWPDPTQYRDAEAPAFSLLRPYLGPEPWGEPERVA
jgi:7-cyano-7-deazaguanine synthase